MFSSLISPLRKIKLFGLEIFKFSDSTCIKTYDYLNYSYLEFKKFPRWFLMRKIGRFNLIRYLISKNLTGKYVPDMLLDEHDSSAIKLDISAEEIAKRLEKDGIFQGLTLNPEIADKILDYALNNPCFANRDPESGFLVQHKELAKKCLGHEILRANFYNLETNCEILNHLKSDPALRKISALYLKTTPVHVNTNMWWSFPCDPTFLEQSKSAQVFHCDLDDFRFLKFFFYLTDVDEDSGPHLYVRGSHTQKPLYRQLVRGRASEEWLRNYYGEQNIITIYGPAGYGFVEDTYGHHMGRHPKSKRRLILQIQYAVHDYGNLHDLVDQNTLKQLLVKL